MLHEAKAYISYQLKARDAHGLHSPFVYKLYTEVISADKEFYSFKDIEQLRYRLLREEREIAITDFGAGSRVFKSNVRKIKDVAKHCLGSTKESKFLFRLIEFMQPEVMLELGTSLGVNTLYQTSANPKGKMITFEGCPTTAALAQEHFGQFEYSPEVVVGNLDETLAEKVAQLDRIDYVFFDANHQYQPTVDYFKICLEKAHNDTVFIFDDIHWSEGMDRAWEEIKAHPDVMLTVDLFQLGLVFFRKEQPKQHFVLKF